MSIRTTVTLESNAYQAARNLAAARHISLGLALSELVNQALSRPVVYESDDLPVFSVAENAPSFGLNEVQKAEDEV